jgi:osmoprotectant transport system permease protein
VVAGQGSQVSGARLPGPLLAACGPGHCGIATYLAEHGTWSGPDSLPHRLVQHVQLSAEALLVALVLALPVAVVLGHLGKGGVLAVNISNVGRAVPSLAVLVIGARIYGLGTLPAFLALVVLAVPPIVTNGYTAVRQVDADVRDAAVGQGLSGGLVLSRIELPLALPLLMAGVRTAGVQVVATATLAAYVGSGGLGATVLSGLVNNEVGPEVVGGLTVVGLAALTELGLAGVQRVLTPDGLRRRPGRQPTLADAIAPDMG